MAELSKNEIAYLKRFLAQHYVRYEDVQLELIDHLATGIEEKQAINPDLKFNDALQDVYSGFGKLGFSQVVKEKEKAMRKFWQKHILRLFLDFLKPPLIFIAIAIFSITYLVQVIYPINFLSLSLIIGLVFFSIIIFLFYRLNVNEDEINKYLYLKTYYSISGSILFFASYLVPSSWINFSNSNIVELNTPLFLFTSIYFTFFIISLYIILFKIPNGLLKKFQQEHQKFALS